MYGTEKINDLSFNCCHSGLCNRYQRNKCKRKKECLKQLCGDEERKIANVSIFGVYEPSDKVWYKMEQAVERWRVYNYKKCKPILMIIGRPRP